eukprot:jgi/Chlat1/1604/Chrsp125S01869
MFQVQSTCGAARAGVLTLSLPPPQSPAAAAQGGPASSPAEAATELTTPALLMYTRRGLPVHLTPDVLEALPSARAMSINPAHFLDQPDPSVLEGHGGGAQGFLSISDRFMLLASLRDPLLADVDRPMRSGVVAIATPCGRRPLTPDLYMRVVQALRPHLFVAIADEVSVSASVKRRKVAVDRSLEWLDHCISASSSSTSWAGSVLGSIQGVNSIEERMRLATATAQRDVAGFSIAGLGMGETPELRQEILQSVLKLLPPDKPRHISGLGMPEEVLDCISHGIDLIESTYPHMLTVDGYAMTFPTSHGSENNLAAGVSSGSDAAKINLRSITHRRDDSPVLPGCTCYTCKRHSRAYLHHLLNTHEMLAEVLLGIHNYHHFLQFFNCARQAVVEQRFEDFKAAFATQRRLKVRVSS